MTQWFFGVIFLFVVPIGLSSPIISPLSEPERLKEWFAERVGGITISATYEAEILGIIRTVIQTAHIIESPQYVLFVDRNPTVQLGTLVFVEPDSRQIFIIGTDKVSTGNPNRKGYFVTPLGFHKNSPKHMSYRALGTVNSKGWRGLGLKGSRVWDFGWRETQTKKGEPYQIRMLLHSTDPVYGEIRLGEVGSKGCIRVSHKFNKFLDQFGILDAEYEKNTRGRSVLPRNRTPVIFAGSYVLVGESNMGK
ncbi:MAG: hypothetical protein WCK48_00845 [bacterium]